jgi:hypothetical protein
MDHLFPVKFAYLMDRVFQNFVDEMGDFYTMTRDSYDEQGTASKFTR